MVETGPTELTARIRRKQEQVGMFLASGVPRKRRLLNVTIIAGTAAAALTAAPAVGGPPFTAWLTSLMGATSPSWRLLCGAASVCSVMATVATQLLKSNNLEERVTRALSCRAKLEVIETGLETGTLTLSAATAEYMRCVEEAAFLET